MGHTPICLPFASAAQYREYVDDPAQYRQYLSEMLRQYPALFPHGMDQGFTLHDAYASVKQDLIMRRITWITTGAVFTRRPSCVMPSMMARTAAVENALSLRQWGVPFDALASVFGRDALCWERAWLAFGRPSRVGTTVKAPQTLPRDLVADEQRTQVAKQQVSVPTTVGGGCFLGVSVVEAADTVTVERGDGACAKAAKALAPDSQACSVCTDGWEATRQAWRGLFPTITLVRCFLHAILKRKKHCAGPLRHQVLDRAWQVSQAATTRQFSQRLRRVAEWTPLPRSGPVATMVLQRCRRRSDCTPADDGPQAHRTSKAVDRLRNSHDRLLYARRSWHGTTDSARLAVRAMARQWPVHPYGARLRRDQPSRVSPFHDLNGLQYHPNWWHNLLMASSMGGPEILTTNSVSIRKILSSVYVNKGGQWQMVAWQSTHLPD
jgi:hypothetical protein